MRFGESLNFPLSFHLVEVLLRPAAFYLILKNDAEVSFFEVTFDAFTERLHMVMLDYRPPHPTGVRGGCSPQNNSGNFRRLLNQQSGDEHRPLLAIALIKSGRKSVKKTLIPFTFGFRGSFSRLSDAPVGRGISSITITEMPETSSTTFDSVLLNGIMRSTTLRESRTRISSEKAPARGHWRPQTADSSSINAVSF